MKMKDWTVIIYLINTILSFSILFLSINYSQKTGNKLSLYIGIAFGLFGITHLIVLMQAGFEHGAFITGIRLFAYSFVILTLVKLLKNTQKHKMILAEMERFKLLFAISPDSVSISSFETGEILDINDSFTSILGYSKSEVVDKPAHEINLWKHNYQRKLLTELLQTSEYCQNYEAEFIRKNGEEITVIISARKIKIENIECMISVIKDISERKKYEEQLKELNSTKDKFFSILAHDLKNPLGNFYSVAEILVDEYDNISEKDKIKYLQIIRESAKQLYSLLVNLLEWSRSQRGLIQLLTVDFDLQMLAENCRQVLLLSASKKYISIENNIPMDTSIFADVNLTNTVLRNLISNAIKFTPIDGKIEIGIIPEQSNDLQTIYVKDNGMGMDLEKLNKLFKIDQSISSKGTADESGTGLGLILCKEFVEMNKGTIWVESELDIGSIFYFTLPKSKAISI